MEWMQQNIGMVLAALILLWMLWRRVLAPKLSGVKSLSSSEYLRLRDVDHLLIDVRSSGEWSSGHAERAKHIPLGDLNHRMKEIAKDKPVVVICASGMRSSQAATMLAKAGYGEVYNFSGGMGAWQGAGFSVVKGR
ncbi:MAG: rhodanese-like domain-containing protein [Zetaproteobacteria bacterium]|nr:rhodanese-like domain-containing protein [Zetaproteobacteria bacterium]